MAIADWIRNALDATFAEPTPQQLAQAARELRDAAATLDRADQDPTTSRRLRGVRRSTNGRTAGDFIVIDRRYDRLELRIGKALWRALACAPRFDVQRPGHHLLLIPIYRGDDGFAISGGEKTMPRIRCTSADDIIRLDDGRYAAAVVGAKIVVGLAIK